MERTIKCIAVDDEAPALRIIEQYISRQPGLILAATFRNPKMAAEWLAANKTDILFLDIQMPQQSGIDMFKTLKPQPLTVFTTAFSEFAADAFDLHAVDYLRKPFSYERFCKALDKAKDYLQVTKQNANELQPQSNVEDDFITIKADGVMIKVPVKDILYIEGFQEYIKVFTTGKRYVIYERLKNMESLLPSKQFMRVHKSYIVAARHVKSIAGNMLEIAGNQIPVSRDLKEEVIKRLF